MFFVKEGPKKKKKTTCIRRKFNPKKYIFFFTGPGFCTGAGVAPRKGAENEILHEKEGNDDRGRHKGCVDRPHGEIRPEGERHVQQREENHHPCPGIFRVLDDSTADVLAHVGRQIGCHPIARRHENADRKIDDRGLELDEMLVVQRDGHDAERHHDAQAEPLQGRHRLVANLLGGKLHKADGYARACGPVDCVNSQNVETAARDEEHRRETDRGEQIDVELEGVGDRRVGWSGTP